MNRDFIIGLIFLLSYGYELKAQNDTARNYVTLEVLGNAGLYSLNYEYKVKTNMTLRIGTCWLPGTWPPSDLNNRTFFYFPFEFNYLVRRSRHHFSISSGILTKWILHYDLPDQFIFNPQIGVGYRYEPPGTFFARAGILLNMPLYVATDKFDIIPYAANHWMFWPGLAAGVKF